MSLDITEAQRKVLDFIREFRRENQTPPTRKEIANYFGFNSPNAAECHLRALENKGYIRISPGKSRGIFDMEKQ